MNPACTGKVIALTLMLTLTGIQYHATDEDCDLIVIPNPIEHFKDITSCDFHSVFKTDSPGGWKVESRTCFDGTLTLPSPSPPLLFFLFLFAFLYFYCTVTLQYTIYTIHRNLLDVSHIFTFLISSQAVRVRLICVIITLTLTLSSMAASYPYRVALVLMTRGTTSTPLAMST